MINAAILERLTDAIAKRGGGAPAIKCQPFYDVLNELFTEAEAELAIQLPAEAMTASQIAKCTGRQDGRELRDMLESMAEKGLLLADEPGENATYKLLPLLPGILEFQFLKGGTGPRDRKIILLIHEYLKYVNKLASEMPRDAGANTKKKTIHLDELVSQIAVIYSYDEALNLINKFDDIAVGNCLCRHRGEITGKPCDKPKDVCMIVGPEAKPAAARGMVKLINKEEARKVLDRAEAAGLVHSSMYHQGGFIEFLCNCCSCHCSTLRGIKRSPAPSEAAITHQVIHVDQETCIGCGECVPRCQTGAIMMEGEAVRLNEIRCIGCGLCRYACPADALKLVKREGIWSNLPVWQWQS